MKRKVEYKYEEEPMSFGYIFKNILTISLVVAVMFHFIIKQSPKNNLFCWKMKFFEYNCR